MQITHQEAHHLIQFRADQALSATKKEILSSHLKECVECAEYANEIQETEATLRTTLRKHWNVHPLPLQVKDVKVKIIPNRNPLDLLATRSALVGMTMIFFFFVIWQFTSANNSFQNPMTVAVPVMPTPSLPLTSTRDTFDHCQMILYEVRQDDTLESIASRFSISENAIRDLNNLQSATATLPEKLNIPVCELTPTGTTHPPTSTTNTPALELITYTPG